MKLVIASLAVAALSGCAAYVPYYGGAPAYPGYGSAPVPYAYDAGPGYPVYPVSPYYGYGGVSLGATIVVPGRGYGAPYRRGWDGQRRHGDRSRWGQGAGSGQHDRSGWHR